MSKTQVPATPVTPITENPIDGLKVNPKIFTSKQGGKTIYYNRNNNKINVITPNHVYFPFGLSTYLDQNKSFNLNISGYKQDTIPLLKALFDFTTKIDEFTFNYILEHSEEIYGEKKTRDGLKELFSPIVQISKPKKDAKTGELIQFAPNIKVSAPIKRQNPNEVGTFKFLVKDSRTGNIIPCIPESKAAKTAIPPKSKGVALLSFPGIWFVGKKFGASCKLKQLVLIPDDGDVDDNFLINSLNTTTDTAMLVG